MQKQRFSGGFSLHGGGPKGPEDSRKTHGRLTEDSVWWPSGFTRAPERRQECSKVGPGAAQAPPVDQEFIADPQGSGFFVAFSACGFFGLLA